MVGFVVVSAAVVTLVAVAVNPKLVAVLVCHYPVVLLSTNTAADRWVCVGGDCRPTHGRAPGCNYRSRVERASGSRCLGSVDLSTRGVRHDIIGYRLVLRVEIG